ncbi:MAG: CFI-box-CTERM domain-containing protein [Deltaproteobacteria bacterium]|jgi:hypothetical protein
MVTTPGLLLLLVAQGAPDSARALQIDLTPTGDPQIAIWLESADGDFEKTIMVTRLVGTFGLGNRPGRPDFGGSLLFPYGRREMALPVWAHRRGVQYDRMVFQDCKESWLGWHEATSSPEPFYCRPMTHSEMNADAISCPTTRFNTDKGMPFRLVDMSNAYCQELVGMSDTSVYPPRNDITTEESLRDWSGVLTMRDMNDLDAVSRATPASDKPMRLTYALPNSLPAGDYVVWVEVNQEYDTNADHVYDYFVDPALRDYGIPHIGQPSIVWQIPIAVTGTAAAASTLEYAGYGAYDGQDGELRPPDGSITSGVDGTGAGRLLVASSAGEDYRVKVVYLPSSECTAPPTVNDFSVEPLEWKQVEVQFTTNDAAARYEIRYQAGRDSITDDDDFGTAVPGPEIDPTTTKQFLAVDALQADSLYTFAVRSYNLCGEPSPIQTFVVRTPERIYATVDACFIATAAYGSKYTRDVVTFRKFRDEVLLTNGPGRWFVEAYYELSPTLAGWIRDHDAARIVVRTGLAPFAAAIRFWDDL